MKHIPVLLALFTWLAPLRAAAPAEVVRSAIDKSLKRIEQGAGNYIHNRQCFSCHHQALPILSLTAARARRFSVESAKLQKQLDFTLATFRPKHEQLKKGQGIPGGNTMAGYALFALDAAGYHPDETTTALVEYLLVRQRSDGSWPAVSNRPPSEGSSFTNAALALRTLRTYGPSKGKKEDELSKRIASACRRGRDWLLHNKPVTAEDKLFRLRGLVYCGAGAKDIAAARDLLLREQRDDGSWSQLPDLKGDAYATGAVLTALAASGLPAADPAYQKGVKFLLGSQKSDGAWMVTTRSRPVQTFFDNGDPGGPSQFISFVATNWATLALLQTIEVPRAPSARESDPFSFLGVLAPSEPDSRSASEKGADPAKGKGSQTLPPLRPTNLDKLNTEDNEDEPHVASDALQLYYTLTKPEGRTDLMVSVRRQKSQRWPHGKLVDGYFSEKADNRGTFLTPEGKYPQYLYFATNKDPEKENGKGDNYDLYVTVRQRKGVAFTAPTPVHGVCTPMDEMHPWLTADGKQLYFSRKTEDGWQIYVANRVGAGAGGYVEPKRVDLPSGFYHPTLTPDGKTMYVQGPLEKDRLGLFRSTRTSTGWSKPEPLTGLNNEAGPTGDRSPSLSRDGALLYFASDRPGGKGGLDIWVIPTVDLVKK
jgi:N-acyl-D-amino-acid deacylase